MNRFICRTLGAGFALGVVLAVLSVAEGQDRAQKRRFAGVAPGASGPLVSAELKEKLALSKEQKEQVEKIEQEYAEKTKDSDSKLKEARQKAIQEKNREAFQKIREMSETAQKVRGEYQDKIKAVLNDEQKKKFDEGSQAARPSAPRVGFRPGSRGSEAKTDLTSKEVQDKLGLSAEQKTKLEQLQKDYDAKMADVLTKEQKDKLEELKKEPARPRFRRPNPR